MRLRRYRILTSHSGVNELETARRFTKLGARFHVNGMNKNWFARFMNQHYRFEKIDDSD